MRQALEHPYARAAERSALAGCSCLPRRRSGAAVRLELPQKPPSSYESASAMSPPDNPLGGIQQVAANQSFEGLVRIGPDGRAARRGLRRAGSYRADRRSMTIQLRPDARFHDGSPVTASDRAAGARQALPTFLGQVFQDINGISASGDSEVVITFKRPLHFSWRR